MSALPTDIDTIIRETRALFQGLKAFSDRLHGNETINASVRAVLEHLHAHGAQTVPAIARDKNVTRQHIQQIVDQAIHAGLAESRHNPAHKRSLLIILTPSGERAFSRMRTREAEAIHRLAPSLAGFDVAAASATLRALRDALASDQRSETDSETSEGDSP